MFLLSFVVTEIVFDIWLPWISLAWRHRACWWCVVQTTQYNSLIRRQGKPISQHLYLFARTISLHYCGGAMHSQVISSKQIVCLFSAWCVWAPACAEAHQPGSKCRSQRATCGSSVLLPHVLGIKFGSLGLVAGTSPTDRACWFQFTSLRGELPGTHFRTRAEPCWCWIWGPGHQLFI